jgi:hypothetical protein
MSEFHVQRTCTVERPQKECKRFWDFCESFGFAVIVLTFAVVVALLLQNAGITFEAARPH